MCAIIEPAKNKRVKLLLGTFVLDCSKELDPMSECILKMMGVFSELERNIISQRVESGIKNAVAKGKVIGRPQTTTENIPAIFYKHHPKYKSKDISKEEFPRLCNLNYPTIYEYLELVEKGEKQMGKHDCLEKEIAALKAQARVRNGSCMAYLNALPTSDTAYEKTVYELAICCCKKPIFVQHFWEEDAVTFLHDYMQQNPPEKGFVFFVDKGLIK